MSTISDDRVAHRFLLQGIQLWGQTAEQREKATRDYVAAAGLMFGSKEANEWLAAVLKNLRRGEFNSEVRQLQEAIYARRAA
jgi:alpha-N-acetylglucosamine transferase